MPILTHEGIEFALLRETRGWTARIPRFGQTMYFASEQEAVDEAARLIDAFLLPRLLRDRVRAA
jgi:hypothetical protein